MRQHQIMHAAGAIGTANSLITVAQYVGGGSRTDYYGIFAYELWWLA